MVREPLATEVRLRELVPLDHRAHGAVEHEDPLPEQRGEALHPGGSRERRLDRAGRHRTASVRRDFGSP